MEHFPEINIFRKTRVSGDLSFISALATIGMLTRAHGLVSLCVKTGEVFSAISHRDGGGLLIFRSHYRICKTAKLETRSGISMLTEGLHRDTHDLIKPQGFFDALFRAITKALWLFALVSCGIASFSIKCLIVGILEWILRTE